MSYVHPPDWENPAPAGMYDLVVLGGGTAGLVCAVGAAGLGARVALVERRLLGGDCLHTGCVPSKALLRAARAVVEARSGAAIGVKTSVAVDFPAVMRHVHEVRLALAPNDSAQRLTSLGIDVFFGSAAFNGPRSVTVEGRVLNFRRAVIATGSHPSTAPDLQPADRPTNNQYTTASIFEMTELPKRMLVIGAGPSGCELAQAFALLGSEVTLADMNDRVLPAEDPDASSVIARSLEQGGVRLALGNRADAHSTDAVLLATGRRASIEGLNLEAAGVSADENGVAVDDHLRTTNRRVFAAGDVCSRHRYTHAADAMARIVIVNALFLGRHRVTDLVIPRCTQTWPEVAAVGDASGAAITIALDAVDRAVVDSVSDGFLRVWHSGGRVRGATIVAPHAGEMIGTIVQLLRQGGTLGDLASTVFPYPSIAAGLQRAGDAYRRSRVTPGVQRVLRTYFRTLRR